VCNGINSCQKIVIRLLKLKEKNKYSFKLKIGLEEKKYHKKKKTNHCFHYYILNKQKIIMMIICSCCNLLGFFIEENIESC